MPNVIKCGDKSHAVCDTCKKVTATTYKYGTFKCDNYEIIHQLLAFCDICGNVTSIPHSSLKNISHKQ